MKGDEWRFRIKFRKFPVFREAVKPRLVSDDRTHVATFFTLKGGIKMKTKIILIFSLVVMLVLGLNSTGFPQIKGYPNKPIQIVATVAAGAGFDSFFRLIAEELKKTWKVPVNILNKPGAGGAPGCSDVANAAKDGHTLLATLTLTPGALTVVDPKGPINLFRDFDPIFVNRAYNSCLLVTRSDSEFKSLTDVINYARKKPGDLLVATGRAGTWLYLEAELLKREAKIDITILPFDKGPAEIIPNVLGGHAHLGIPTDNTAYPQIQAGRMRGLVFDAKSIVYPNIPTYADLGYPAVGKSTPTFGLFGPKGMSPEVIKTWEKGLEALLKEPTFVDFVHKKLHYNLNIIMGAELHAFLKEELEIYSRFTPEELGYKK